LITLQNPANKLKHIKYFKNKHQTNKQNSQFVVTIFQIWTSILVMRKLSSAIFSMLQLILMRKTCKNSFAYETSLDQN